MTSLQDSVFKKPRNILLLKQQLCQLHFNLRYEDDDF